MKSTLARWIPRGAWVLVGLALAWLIAFSGTDVGSTILFALALVLGGAAATCAGRAIGAASARDALLWAGRALGVAGAAVAVSFPSTIYQEIAMLTAQGRPLTYDMQRAFWYEIGVMPLVVVPALIALRWPRAGGVLFLVEAALTTVLALSKPFGVIYPEATGGATADLISLAPPIITAFLLLLGTTRPPLVRASA